MTSGKLTIWNPAERRDCSPPHSISLAEARILVRPEGVEPQFVERTTTFFVLQPGSSTVESRPNPACGASVSMPNSMPGDGSHRKCAEPLGSMQRSPARTRNLALVEQDGLVHVLLWILLEHDRPQVRRYTGVRRIEELARLLWCATAAGPHVRRLAVSLDACGGRIAQSLARQPYQSSPARWYEWGQ